MLVQRLRTIRNQLGKFIGLLKGRFGVERSTLCRDTFGTSVPACIALPSERQHQSCNSQPDKNDHYYNPWSVNTQYKHARHRKRDKRRGEDTWFFLKPDL